MKKLLVGILALISSSIVAQGQQQLLEKANALFNAGAYTEAIAIYRDGGFVQAIDKSLRGEVFYKIGEAYRRMGQTKQAEIFYERAISRGYEAPELYLNYAKVLLINENYEKSREIFQKYGQLKPNSPEAENGIKSIDNAIAWKKSPTSYTVEPLPFLNTKFNEYAPSLAPNDPSTIYFTSSRSNATGPDLHSGTGEKFADIFSAKIDNRDKFTPPMPVGDISTPWEEGTSTFSRDGAEMYFSRARVVKHKKTGSEILKAVSSATKYINAVVIPIAEDTVVVSHPSLSEDGKTLYFTSNLPGGYGGMDIWRVSRTDEKAEWGKPENLGGDINTAGNEVFPYIHPDGTLYFSTDSRPGMGGLDIFKAKPKEGGWVVENMHYPINSSADDFGIVFIPGKEAGYFSSRRIGGKGGDDIYMFNLPPIAINISGLITESKTKIPVDGALVKLLGNDGSAVNTQTGTDGTYKFMMKPNTDYIVIASKKGFLNGKYKVNTFDVKQNKEYTNNIEITSYEKPVEVPNVFYDFDKWDLKSESKAALDLLIETLNDNPSIIIELGSHTDSRGGIEYNYNLSQKRAQAVVDYLIEKGVATERLRAKGYASSSPKTVDDATARQYPFLKAGMVLNDQTIAILASDEQKDVAHQLNRRTEFKVISNTYIPKSK